MILTKDLLRKMFLFFHMLKALPCYNDLLLQESSYQDRLQYIYRKMKSSGFSSTGYIMDKKKKKN